MTAQLHTTRTALVRCRVGDVVRHGRAVTIDQNVDEKAVVAAVRGESVAAVTIDAPTPQPVHEHVGYIHAEMGLRTRTALARAARCRGATTPYDEQIESVRATRDSIAVDGEGDSRATHREAVAEQTAETARLRERVATLRGKLQAARENGDDVDAITDKLEAAIRELTEVETESEAERQRLDGARETARERRDKRERIRRLDDRIENLKRDARAHLVDEMTDEFTRALAAVPGGDPPSDPFEADAVTAGLAIARLAEMAAPVVLGCDRFESAGAAADWLDCPVLKV